MVTRSRSKGVVDKEALARLYASGASIQRCMENFGVGQRTVMAALAEHGIETRGKLPKTPTAVEDEIVAMRSRGSTIAEVASATGVSARTVARILHQRSAKARVDGMSKQDRGSADATHKELDVRMVNRHLSGKWGG